MKLPRAPQRRGLWIVCAALAGAPLLIGIETPTPAFAQSAAPLSSQQLDALTAPIALYPDALLAQVLMASTFPQDVQAAATWSRSNSNLQGDDAVKAVASQTWDPSVQSLVAFPQVLATMASKPDWVSQIGNAFLAQPNDVMDSVQRLRRQAQQAGNLKTSEQQKVIVEQSTIQIVPVNPEVVYVPTYNPTVVYGAWPYPAYPPVYIPPPPGYAIAAGFATGLAFGAGIAVANSLWGGFNWNNHDVNINVNRYNNINVNNRINANGGTSNWNRNTNLNHNYQNVNRNNQNVNRNTANLSNAQRDQFRGRDASRAQAQQTLQSRTGQNLGGSASERVQGIQHGGNNGGNLRNNAQNANRDNAGNPRNNAQNANRDNAGNLRNSAQNANRDNALRGAGNGNEARQEAQRGQQSRQQIQNRPAGGANAGGGMRQGGGGQAAGGGMRQGGGAGAAGGGMRQGGGGGGGRLGGGGGGQRHMGR